MGAFMGFLCPLDNSCGVLSTLGYVLLLVSAVTLFVDQDQVQRFRLDVGEHVQASFFQVGGSSLLVDGNDSVLLWMDKSVIDVARPVARL
jgi:hypothetical protein